MLIVRRRTLLLSKFKLQFQSFLQNREDFLQRQTDWDAKVEKVYRRTPPYLTYIEDSIDQVATRLGKL